MANSKNPILETLEKKLKADGFAIEKQKNGFSIELSSMNLPCQSAEFYSLLNSPDQVRAKVKSSSAIKPLENEDLAKIQKRLQQSVNDAVRIDVFTYFGQKDDSHVYYAYISKFEPKANENKAKETEIQAQGVKSSRSATSSPKKIAEITLNQLAHIDSKTFRMGLDKLGIPRSSLVRIGLTRIFRESMTPDEMLEIIREEANKIVNNFDWEQVKQLKSEVKDRVPFLYLIVHLLWDAVAKECLARGKPK